MGHFTKAPIYLDKSSQLEDMQIRAINNTLKSQYNRMMSQGAQKQSPKPDVGSPYTARGLQVDDLICYDINGMVMYTVKMTVSGEINQDVTIVETDKAGRLIYCGHYDNVDLADAATIFYDYDSNAIKLRLGVKMENKTIKATIWLYPVAEEEEKKK